MRVVCGLLEPTEGQVRVGGVDVLRDPERAQEHIGYLSDFFSLYEDLKVWEYLDYFAHAYKMAESEIPARVDRVITHSFAFGILLTTYLIASVGQRVQRVDCKPTDCAQKT
jgi:ABC-type multidrug transport system ATPase subunit